MNLLIPAITLFVLLVLYALAQNPPIYSGVDTNPGSYIHPVLIPNFLTPDECNFLIKKHKNSLKKATVGNYNISPGRNNKVSWESGGNPIAQKIFKKTQKLTGLPQSHIENIQIANYKPKQYYKHHYDQCQLKSCVTKRKNPRAYTVLIYLEDNFKGGATDFRHLNQSFKGRKGDAIFFHSLNKNKTQVHQKSLHAGLSVNSGEKWIANVWVHLKPR